MVPDADDKSPALKLPDTVFGQAEVRRLKRELESLDDFMRQANLREAGKQPPLPKTSRLLDALASENGLNMLQAADRTKLSAFLEQVDQSAPVLHFSFAADPSVAFLTKLVAWLRENMHPQVMINLGLQPTLAAGCIVRTPRRSFDLSLRQHLLQQAPLLAKAVQEAESAPSATPSVGVRL